MGEKPLDPLKERVPPPCLVRLNTIDNEVGGVSRIINLHAVSMIENNEKTKTTKIHFGLDVDAENPSLVLQGRAASALWRIYEKQMEGHIHNLLEPGEENQD